jgi:hypothetical protein
VVDGHNGYDANAAEDIHSHASGEPFISFGPRSFDAQTGDLTQTETEEIVRCEAADGSAVDATDPSSSECVQFAPTGVKLVRTVATGESGLQATVTDQFESTSGTGHTISVSYGEEQGDGPVVSYKFPGESSFTARENEQAPAGTGAPETVYYQTNDEASNPENSHENARGAITLSTVPSAVKFGNDEYFELIYANRTVPASGSLTFVQVLSQSLTQSQVEALAADAQAQLADPTLSISSPASGTTVSTPTVQVSGTASDNLGIASLTLNGAPVAVGSGGAWSANPTLSVGANTITLVATDSAGKTTSKSITVTYTPPVPAPAPAKATQVGAASGANGKVSFTLACTGAAGTTCHVQVALTTIEKTHGKKITGVTAKTKSKKVTVATLNVTIKAGSRVKLTIGLNATGRKLLAHFHKLPVHLSAILTGASKSTIVAQNLTIKPAHKKKKKH